MNPRPMTLQDREKALYLYSVALEQDDFETITQILQTAEDDPVLERMLLELNDVYQSEEIQAADEETVALVRRMLREHLPSALPAEEVALPALTVGDVIAKMRAEAAQRGAAGQETLAVAKQLKNSPAPIPFPLRLPEVRRLLKHLGVSASRQFEKLFQDAATFLSMGRGQHLMAATRRQKKSARGQSQGDKP